MKNLKLSVVKMEGYNVVDYIKIDNVIYKSNMLSDETLALVTAMTYDEYECTIEYFDSISQMLGYDTVLEGIQELMYKGAKIATAEIYRKLVMDSFKMKHKGLMR